MGFLCSLVCLLGVQSQDAGVADLLRRLDADEPGTRESASRELDGFCRKLGTKAAGVLETLVARTEGEATVRLQAKLLELRRAETCRKSIESLEALELPSLGDKPLVIYNTGRSWSCNGIVHFNYVVGWLLDQSELELRILCPNADIRVCSRKPDAPAKGEKTQRPSSKKRPLPYQTLEIPPQEAYQRVSATIPVALEDEPYTVPIHPIDAESFESALFIRWALERGDYTSAWDLLKASETAFVRKRPGKHRPYPPLLSELVCTHLRYQALRSREPRAGLIKQWKVIERLQPDYNGGEPRRMIQAYQKQIVEEASWKEPSPPHHAEYWIYRLRDLAVVSESDPGECLILTGQGKPDGPFAPEELVKLGWEALPALIDHLDDGGPTRSVGSRVRLNRKSYYLLRVGDCCRQIFEKITGVPIEPRPSPDDPWIPLGADPAPKENAQKWWAQNGPGGPERFFLASLEKPGMTATAAATLLAINAAKHRSRLLEVLEKGPRWARNDVLAPLEPYLGKEQESLIGAIAEEEEGVPLSTAAEILWRRYHSDRGALVIAARHRALEPDDEDRFQQVPSLWILRTMRTEKVARALAELLSSKNARVRYDAISVAPSFPHPAIAAALAAQLGDPTPTGWTGQFEIRFCDAASEALSTLTGAGGGFELSGSPEERDRTIARLKEWWEAQHSRLDWKHLLDQAQHADSGGSR